MQDTTLSNDGSIVRWDNKWIEEMSREELLGVLYTIVEYWFEKEPDCPSAKDEKEPIKTFQVWSEGYSTTGQYSDATFHGEFSGKTFREAVEKFKLTCSREAQRTIDLDRMTYWGSKFFNNEQDARKRFG